MDKDVNLSDINFQISYDTHKGDNVADFYDSALSHAKFYDRISAYFDSKILSYYAQGVEHIYNNGGKIRFIFSEDIPENDFNMMKEGYKERAIKQLADDFDREPLDENDKNNLGNLAFLISQGVVDIKIAFLKPGIFHYKKGLIHDENGNYVYFRGSNNETVAAATENGESFEVSCSRDAENKENLKIKEAIVDFEKMRNNTFSNGIVVVDIPDIIKNKIAKYDRGQLILNKDYSLDDAIVADISNDDELIVINNLKDNRDIEHTFDFENFISYSLIKKEKNKFVFGRLGYKKINQLLGHFVDLATDIDRRFIETQKLKQYLIDRIYNIDQRKELGKLIKKQHPFVIEDFNRFSHIVNEEMERKLREKQMRDAFFMCWMIKSANYSVPGSGKTSIVYGAYAYLTAVNIKKIDTMIVIGPVSSFKSWVDEYKACFGEKRQPRILNILQHKNKKERESLLRYETFDLILINYEVLNSIKDVLAQIVNARTLLVFDEIHKIKAINGVWASAALSICEGAIYKIALTGTPIPNSYADLYNQLKILYTDEYEDYFDMSPHELRVNDDNTRDKINQLIYPFFCRTTKADLKIPIPNPDIINVAKMTNQEQQLFSIIHKRCSNNSLLLYVRLLQASTNPKLILSNIDEDMIRNLYESEEENELQMNIGGDFKDLLDNKVIFNDNEISFIKSFDMTSKFREGIKQIESLVSENKTVLVWGIFVNTIDRIHKELNERGISNKIIYGSVPVKEREEIIEEFKARKIQVLITNPHTMAESVSLHQTCHDSVYFEYSFNLTHMLQSKDRINRLGLPQDQYTQYYYMFLSNDTGQEDSIDKRTYTRLKEKEDIMLKAIEGEQIVYIDFSILDDLRIIMKKN